MDAVKFIKEKLRMCKGYKMCNECDLCYLKTKVDMDCDTYIEEYPEQAVAIVEKWSQEHPQKTFLSDFLEKYHKAKLRNDGTPTGVCPEDLGYCKGRYCNEINKLDCLACWNRPLEE